MKLTPEFSDQLVDLVKNVSDDLPEDAENLLSEDPSSLREYLGSEPFLNDLRSYSSHLRLGTDVFFFILFHQLRRKFREEEQFRIDFKNSLSETTDRNWKQSTIQSFLADQQLTIYLVNMLDDFIDTRNVHSMPTSEDKEYHYVFEMIEASQNSSDTEAYRIFCHIGNYSLYLTGIFPDWIRYRHERKNRPMKVDDYSDYGKTYFKRASNHRLAKEKHMKPVLKKLSQGFDLVRTGLELLFKRIVPAFE